VPKSAPAWFRERFSRHVSGAVVAHRIWVVDAPLKQVVRYIRAHARSRPRPEGAFGRPANRIGSRPSDAFLFHPVAGRSSSRWLDVNMRRLPSGATVVGAQAGDTWIHPPVSANVLGANVRRIDITSAYWHAKPSVRVHVRTPFDVASIVSWLNGLGTTAGYVCFGGWWGGPHVTLTFRSKRGTALARAQLAQAALDGASGACNPLSLTVGSRNAVALLGGDFLPRIDRLLGIDVTPPSRQDIRYCVHAAGWRTHSTRRGMHVYQSGRRWTIMLPATGKVTLDRKGPRTLERCLDPPTPAYKMFYG